MDLFINEITPAFTRRSELAYRLSTDPDVKNYELPPEFCSELHGLLAVLASDATQLVNDSMESMQFLRSALQQCREIQTPTVDAMTADLARLVERIEGPAQALALVRRRAERDSPLPAPDLLRAGYEFTFKLSEIASDDDAATLRQEGVSWLEKAASQEADPERDVTLYNLALAVNAVPGRPTQDEGLKLLEQVASISPYYKRAWYVHRQLGSMYWAKHLNADGREAVELAETAARHYARAIRKRPRARWFYLDHNEVLHIRKTFQRLPIMYANASDADMAIGHLRRARARRVQAARERGRMLKIATDAAERGEWDRAYAFFDWSCIGWGDVEDVLAHVARALSAERMDLPRRLVQDAWEVAYSRYPDAVDGLRTELEDRWP